MGGAENQISNLEYKEAKNNQSKQKEEKRVQNKEDSVRSLWDNFKSTNICMMESLEGEQKEQEIGNVFEKNIGRKLPSLGEGNRYISLGSAESPQ